MLLTKNSLMIAAAGSGKTTLLVNKALDVKDKRVLITTYTEANEEEINRKIINVKGYIPENITIQTWFSFLLKHGVRPYQESMHLDLFNKKIGFYLSEKQSGFRYLNAYGFPVYWGEGDLKNYYFSKKLKIYSDKISKFIIECDKKTDGLVFDRISRIYSLISIDEVQDLAGWDLEILKRLFQTSSKILLVGDPRQVTYLTNQPRKYTKYKNGRIKDFIIEKCEKEECYIDEKTLQNSHRNNRYICEFSSKLYNDFNPCVPCGCEKCRENNPPHQGIFLVKPADVESYCNKYNPQKLRYQKAVAPELNYGMAKGLGFDRILIYPTNKIISYLENGDLSEVLTIKAKFYVSLTRARYSVGIVCDYSENDYIKGVEKYKKED